LKLKSVRLDDHLTVSLADIWCQTRVAEARGECIATLPI